MAAARHGRDGHLALIVAAALAAMLSLAPHAGAESTAPPDSALAGPDSSFTGPMPESALPDSALRPDPAGHFVVRRVANPRYRPSTAAASGLATPVVEQLRALDRLHAQVAHRGSTPASRTTQWDFSVGETYRNEDAVGISASGEVTPLGSSLLAARVEGRRGALRGALGDMPGIALDRIATLNRLRGAVARIEGGADAPTWSAWGGGPTPLPRRPTPPLGMGGAAVQGVRLGGALASFGLTGFGRGALPASPAMSTTVDDTLAGGGGEVYAGARRRLPIGQLGVHLAAQTHDLEGTSRFAGREMVEWSLVAPYAALFLSEERAAGPARTIGTEGFLRAATREDRWNLQARPFGGRAEAHTIGAIRDGGEPTLASRTYQLGASTNVGASAWYAGVEHVWDWRALTGVEERRLTLHAGRVSTAGRALTARLERTTSDAGRNAVLLGGEASLPAGRGVRLALEPRATWDGGALQQAYASTHVTWPVTWCAARISATLTVGATRDEAFRGSLREASIGIAFAPRFRDRAELEVRSLHDGPVPAVETTASYDLTAQRTRGQEGWLASRDSSRIEVVVARSGNNTGVQDVLVSMDGKDLRFTDADGVARFEGVAPGLHVIAIEERSLPAPYEAVGNTRVFVTVERGVAPDAVRFTIARPVRRIQFVPGNGE